MAYILYMMKPDLYGGVCNGKTALVSGLLKLRGQILIRLEASLYTGALKNPEDAKPHPCGSHDEIAVPQHSRPYWSISRC